jgi:hypothetical protein
VSHSAVVSQNCKTIDIRFSGVKKLYGKRSAKLVVKMQGGGRHLFFANL